VVVLGVVVAVLWAGALGACCAEVPTLAL